MRRLSDWWLIIAVPMVPIWLLFLILGGIAYGINTSFVTGYESMRLFWHTTGDRK